MKVKQLLNKKNWICGALACNEEGLEVNPRAKSAVSFCLLGAIKHCYRGSEITKITKLVQSELKAKDYYPEIDCWNDATTTSFGMVKRLVNKLDI